MGRRLSIAWSLVATLVVTLVAPAGTAPALAAAPTSPPTVFDLSPAFGEVVDAGSVVVSAVGLSDREVVSTRLEVDGRTLSGVSVSGPSSRERKATAVVAVTPGDHVARFTVEDAAGRTRSRSWRFTASAVGVLRLAGPTPIDQAVNLSKRLYGTARTRDAAVLARADELADALTGVPLAHHLDAPLLLTERARLSPATRGELSRALAPGATVHVLGGAGAIVAAVDDELRDLGFTVVRHFGPDRYATAAEIAAALPASRRVFVASGTSFADALAASAPAARDGAPILLTTAGRLPDATTRFLRDHDVAQAVIAGGAAVVGSAVAQRIGQEVESVVRVGGRDRSATSALLVDRYYPSARTLGLADGGSMADALLGARHAAASGNPLLLVSGATLGPEADRTVRRLQPGGLLAYGRSDVLGTPDILAVRRAAEDGPAVARIRRSDPAPRSTVGALDTIVVDFDRELVLASSNVYVELDGVEVTGRTVAGDFTDTLVFQVDRIHTVVQPGTPYDVRVVTAVYDGERWAHDELRFTFVKRELARGDAGSEVEYVQRRLTDLGYWLGPVDGQYGLLTSQAVMAFEKVNGLPRDGVLDDRVRELLETAERPRAHTTLSYVFEVDKTRQVVFIARYGRVEWILNTSTGTEDYYTHEGQRKLATTPVGTFRVSRQVDGLREAPLGTLWRPKYFNGGIALHGSTSVPGYPASHGCVRLTYAAMDWIWAEDLMPIGTTVVVH